MHHNYEDIRSRIAEPPVWFDENSVPRYCEFGPDEVADIYCNEVALVLIGCQACGTLFKVAFSSDSPRWAMEAMDREEYKALQTEEQKEKWFEENRWPMANYIRDLHYGDPPNIGCCPSGPTMNCDDFKVLEYWRRDKSFKWVRYPEFEVILPDHPEWGIE